MTYDARHGHADRLVALRELRQQLHEHLGDVLRHRLLRRPDPHAVGGELAGDQVDRGPLDARAAEVDPERPRRHHSSKIGGVDQPRTETLAPCPPS